MEFIKQLDLTTPSLLFSAISLILLAYTNRFLSYASVVRSLKEKYEHDPASDPTSPAQIENFVKRLKLIRAMQMLGAGSLLLCISSMFFIYIQLEIIAHVIFGIGMLMLAASLVLCIREVQISTEALSIHIHSIRQRQREHAPQIGNSFKRQAQRREGESQGEHNARKQQERQRKERELREAKRERDEQENRKPKQQERKQQERPQETTASTPKEKDTEERTEPNRERRDNNRQPRQPRQRDNEERTTLGDQDGRERGEDAQVQPLERQTRPEGDTERRRGRHRRHNRTSNQDVGEADRLSDNIGSTPQPLERNAEQTTGQNIPTPTTEE